MTAPPGSVKSSGSWRDVALVGAVAAGHRDVRLGGAGEAPRLLFLLEVHRGDAPAGQQRVLVTLGGDRVGDLLEGPEAVAADERVAVRQRGDEPARARREVARGDARVDPHDAVGEPGQA